MAIDEIPERPGGRPGSNGLMVHFGVDVPEAGHGRCGIVTRRLGRLGRMADGYLRPADDDLSDIVGDRSDIWRANEIRLWHLGLRTHWAGNGATWWGVRHTRCFCR